MSAFLEDAMADPIDSSLNQSFSLSQANYNESGDMPLNQLLYRVDQSNLRESSTDFWKKSTMSQKLQSQNQTNDKNQPATAMKKPKAI